MTPEEIDALETGPELDELVMKTCFNMRDQLSEEVKADGTRGWVRTWDFPEGILDVGNRTPSPSTNIAHAWPLAHKYSMELRLQEDGSTEIRCYAGPREKRITAGDYHSAPPAICRAALKCEMEIKP